MDTLGHLLALHVTHANEQDRAQVRTLAREVQNVMRESVPLAYVDQGDTGDHPKADAADEGIELNVVKLDKAKRGFVLLPRRWVAERSFAWVTRFRRFAREYKRLHSTLATLRRVAFACLILKNLMLVIHQCPLHALGSSHFL